MRRGACLGSLGLFDPVDVLAPVRVRHLREALLRGRVGGERRREVGGHVDGARLGVEHQLDLDLVARLHGRRRAVGAIEGHVRPPAVDAGRRTERVAVDGHAQRGPRAAERGTHVDGRLEHRGGRLALRDLDARGEANRVHHGNPISRRRGEGCVD